MEMIKFLLLLQKCLLKSSLASLKFNLMDSIQFFNFPSGNTCEARIMYQAVEQGVGGDFSSQETSNEGHEEQREQVKCVVCEVS